MVKTLEKVERRLGEKLFIKGERCAGPKCAYVRRASKPGKKGGGKTRRKSVSEFGLLLREKQKARFLYGLDDNEIERYCNKASSKPGVFGINFLNLLENRLDNVVFRLGFAESRREARHIVRYGHILVNDRKLNIPSYTVKKGDKISIKKKTLESPMFIEVQQKLKKYEPPKWLSLQRSEMSGTIVSSVEEGDLPFNIDLIKIKEFYSR